MGVGWGAGARREGFEENNSCVSFCIVAFERVRIDERIHLQLFIGKL